MSFWQANVHPHRDNHPWGFDSVDAFRQWLHTYLKRTVKTPSVNAAAHNKKYAPNCQWACQTSGLTGIYLLMLSKLRASTTFLSPGETKTASTLAVAHLRSSAWNTFTTTFAISLFPPQESTVPAGSPVLLLFCDACHLHCLTGCIASTTGPALVQKLQALTRTVRWLQTLVTPARHPFGVLINLALTHTPLCQGAPGRQRVG